MAAILYFLILSILHVLHTNASNEESCTCNVGKVKFSDCSLKNQEARRGNHHDEDIGLHGDCLPHVPENTMKCFKWRVARQCGEDGVEVRCNLRHRSALDATLEPTHQKQSVTFRSPGFYRQNTSEVKGAYFNRNFCIFNISLNCSDNMVELTPFERTNTLSDADTCEDYLSFHTHSATHPQFKLCGRQIMDRDRYQLMSTSSFYGVLWTNDNTNESGRFELQAKCKNNPEVDNGSRSI